MQKDVRAAFRDLSNLENQKIDRTQSNSQYQELRTNHNSLYTQLSISKNHLLTIENFIEKYLPVRVLNQVSDIIEALSEEKKDE